MSRWQRSLTLTAQEYLHRDDYDLSFRFEQPQPRELATQEATVLVGTAPMEGRLRTWITIRGKDGVPSPSYQLIALPSDSVFLRPKLVEGRWLQPDDTDAVVINGTLLQREPDLRIGSLIQIKAYGTERTW